MESATTYKILLRTGLRTRQEMIAKQSSGMEVACLLDYLKKEEPGFRSAVRRDLVFGGILCGPEIKYDGNSLEGTITHSEGKAKNLIIPYFHCAKIEDALKNDWNDKRNLTYLQNLTSMHTSGEEIINAFVELGGRIKEHIRLQTMMPGDRKKYNSTCTAMFLRDGKFIIGSNRSLEFNAGVCYSIMQ